MKQIESAKIASVLVHDLVMNFSKLDEIDI